MATNVTVRGISLPMELDRQVVTLSKQTDVPISRIIRRALEAHLAQQSTAPQPTLTPAKES